MHGAILYVVEIAKNLPTTGNIPSLCSHQGKRFHSSGRKAIQKSNNWIHFIMNLVELNQTISVLLEPLYSKNNLEEIRNKFQQEN